MPNILDLLGKLPDPRLIQPKMQGMPMMLGGQLPRQGGVNIETQTSPHLALRGEIQPGAYDKPQSTWDKIMGTVAKGFSGGQGQLLPEDARKAALKRGLLGSGLAMIEASGNRPVGTQPNIAQILGRGLAAGQEGYQEGLGGYLGEQQMAQQMRQQEMRQQIMLKYANMPQTPETMQNLFNDLVAIGDYEGAKPIAEVLKSGMGQNKLEIVKAENGLIYAINPYTGERVNTIGLQRPDGSTMPLSDSQFQKVEQITDNFNQQTSKYQEQALSFARVRTAAGNLLSAMAAGQGNEAAASSLALVYAYAKLLDPGSVVREGELRLTLAQGSLFDKLMNMWKRAKEGTMSPRLVESMMREAIGQTEQAQNTYNLYLDSARERVERQVGIPRDYFIAPDPFQNLMAGIPQEWTAELSKVAIDPSVQMNVTPADVDYIKNLESKYGLDLGSSQMNPNR